MAATMRDRFRTQVREEVKAAALEQLATGGPQAVSVNAIAKQLGVSGPALYRYFRSRDDLITELTADAYADIADALAGATGDTPEARLRAQAAAYRSWALAHPHRYRLLYAPPFPGYDAHAETLVGAARRSMEAVAPVVAQLTDAPEAAVLWWSRLHGLVSLEIGGNWASMGLDADALLEAEVEQTLASYR